MRDYYAELIKEETDNRDIDHEFEKEFKAREEASAADSENEESETDE